MKIKDLRAMSREDLKLKMIELRKELIKHKAQISTGTAPKSPGQVKGVKKTIAQILTILNSKEESRSPGKEKKAVSSEKPVKAAQEKPKKDIPAKKEMGKK